MIRDLSSRALIGVALTASVGALPGAIAPAQAAWTIWTQYYENCPLAPWRGCMIHKEAECINGRIHTRFYYHISGTYGQYTPWQNTGTYCAR